MGLEPLYFRAFVLNIPDYCLVTKTMLKCAPAAEQGVFMTFYRR
jgi:hypothetical protein